MDLYDEIAKVAYELFERDGYVHGKDLEHWAEAEIIVRARYETANQVEPGQATEEPKQKKPATKKSPSKRKTVKKPAAKTKVKKAG